MDLLQYVAPKMMKRGNAHYSYGIADDLDDNKYGHYKYWSNPLETKWDFIPSPALSCEVCWMLILTSCHVLCELSSPDWNFCLLSLHNLSSWNKDARINFMACLVGFCFSIFSFSFFFFWVDSMFGWEFDMNLTHDAMKPNTEADNNSRMFKMG